MNALTPASSQALHFFQMIAHAERPAEYLRSLVKSNPPSFESEWLDFKGAAQLTATRQPPEVAGKNAEKVKEIWSEALSGFANTQGGVLVWGIDAPKDPATGIDAASTVS
jgi:hypothetical protein